VDTAAFLAMLLALYRPPQNIARCLERRHDRIIAQADAAAEAHQVPVTILLVTAFLETHIGCDRGEGDGWGAPAHASTPHVAGTADNAASSLALGFRTCHTWLSAVRNYRRGLCDREPLIGYTAAYALHVVELVSIRAGVALPTDFRFRTYASASSAPP
jgi:hypothetical protein